MGTPRRKRLPPVILELVVVVRLAEHLLEGAAERAEVHTAERGQRPDHLLAAQVFLDKAVAKNRKQLLKTVSFPGTPTQHDPESVVR